MSKEITDWIKYELYPSLFERIDIAFPEHSFKRFSGGWRSKTYLDGSPHKSREDKTVVTKKAPRLILEQGGEALNLIDYVVKRDGVGFIQAVKTLADVAGLQLPKGEFPKGDYSQESYQRYKDRATLLEDCNRYFIYCIENDLDAVAALSGVEISKDDMLFYGIVIKDYLHDRGYSDEDIKAMELGYIYSQEWLIRYLFKKGYNGSLIDEIVRLNKGIGSTHQLTIPYRSGGVIKGFKFRAVGDVTPKYLNSTGLDKIGGFFNLSGIKGDKDIVIVEGELDALHATVKGVENVVATGGSSINAEQIRDAIKRGAKSFTLCFDTEPGKEEETKKRINSAIEVILGEGVNRVYIVTLPDLDDFSSTELFTEDEQKERARRRDLADKVRRHKLKENKETGELEFMYKPGEPIPQKTDPDRLIKEKGVDSFKAAIAQALPYYDWRLDNVFKRYNKIIDNDGGLTSRQVLSLEDEVVAIGLAITEPMERDIFKATAINYLKGWGVTKESLSITVDRLTSTRDKEAQAKSLQELISKVKEHQDKGETDRALDLLDSKVKEVKLKDKATEFSSLLLPVKETDLRERLEKKPESLNSGYSIGGEPLLLPSGAISILSAPTSHGKTTFLINMALNVATAYPDKETYLFSYEEDGDSVLLNTLNTYLDEEISTNNRRTLRSYFTTGSTEYVKKESRDSFIAGKDKFFKELIDTRRLNINYSSYNSDTIIEAIRYLHKHAKPGSIFIDYIQLLNLPEGKYKTYSRQEEIKEICIALKDVAVETGLPIILGAQFNRTVENQLQLYANKIGEAGDIERIANLIVGFWNNNFKPLATEGELKEINNRGLTTPDTLYTTILKQRGGRVGLEEILSFNGNTGKIKNSSSSGSSYFK